MSSSIQEAVGSYIAALRQKAGLRVDQLAQKCGLSGECLNAIERGEENLSLGTMVLLAMALDTTPQELFSGVAQSIDGGLEVPFDLGRDSRTISYGGNRPKEVWIGSVEVRPLKGCELFDYSLGAFVHVVTWVADADEYREKVVRALWEMRVFVLEIESPEPVETKRSRDGRFEASIEEIIEAVKKNPNATVCGEFSTYQKTDT